MKDINRIEPFMEKLTEVWKEQPDLRFGELIKNITHGNDMVNYNERQFLELIDIYRLDTKVFTDEEYLELLYNVEQEMQFVLMDIQDKGGNPYINHLYAVRNNVDKPKEKIVAMLHELLEDTTYTEKYLIELGIPKELRDAVKSLSRSYTQSYKEYINNIEMIGNRLVITVKLADLKDNMNILRISNPTKEDGQRIKKIYIPAYKKLEKRLEEIKFESNALEGFLKKQGVYTELKSLIDKWGNT